MNHKNMQINDEMDDAFLYMFFKQHNKTRVITLAELYMIYFRGLYLSF